MRTRPQHPRGEDAVEERLHQRRAEEAPAPFALEPDAKRVLKCRAHRGKLRRAARRLDAGEAIACVGGEQPRQVPRFRQRRTVRQRPREVLAKARPRIAGKRARLLQTTKELVLAAGEPQRFERRGPATCVLTHQHEVAGVRHEHQPVAPPSSGWPERPAAVSHASSASGFTSTTPRSGIWPSRGAPLCTCFAAYRPKSG